MEQLLRTVVIGGAALLLLSRHVPESGMTLCLLGLGLVLHVVLRRQRHLTMSPN